MVNFALDLEPTKAIEFLQSKGDFAKRIDEPALRDSARARAARIANLSSLDLTANIYELMAEAKRNGQAYGAWVKDVLAMFDRKGWLYGYDSERKEYIIADPDSGEIFGTPRRLETIYRTNMQAAFSAQTYQQLMDGADSRPYWQYSAILDHRTRPRHAAMHGLVFRFDDPFWATFYPPNGFNCRCTVKALNDRDLARRGLEVADGSKMLEEVEIEPRKGLKHKTVGVKTGGSVLTADYGFDYNVGRRAYRPNLDLYPEKLAHQFAKKDMASEEFKRLYHWLDQKSSAEFEARGFKDKKAPENISRDVQEALRLEHIFAAGIIRESDAKLIGAELRSAWISDSTLVKQFNSRKGDKNFGLADYTALPDVLHNPDHILAGGKDFIFYKNMADGQGLLAVIKILKTKEIFVLSVRRGKIEDEMRKEKNKVIR